MITDIIKIAIKKCLIEKKIYIYMSFNNKRIM